MNKKFELNGIKVELSKEKLQDMLKEYDKPVGEVKADHGGDIRIYKNNIIQELLLASGQETVAINLSLISRDMARVMDDLMKTKDAFDKNTLGYYVVYDNRLNCGGWFGNAAYPSRKHFNSEATAKLAAKLLNESKDMKEGIERMSK